MLVLENIQKTFFPGEVNEKKALKGVDIHLKEGDFITVIGGNGAGKSTLLNCIAGFYSIENGRITLNKEDVTKNPEYKRAKEIARVFQDPLKGTAATMTIEENMVMAYKRGLKRSFRLAVKNKEKSLFQERLEMLNLGLENRLDDKVGLLSGGQRQALTLLMATLQKPKLLLLDEHTSALDPKTAAKVMEITEKLIKEYKLTSLMVTHNMEQAIDSGNRLIMMDQGNIVVDLKEDEKKDLTVNKLMELFTSKAGAENLSDRMLLNKKKAV